MARDEFLTLGESHRRSISTTLVILDEMLCDFEEIAHGRERRSVVFAERNDLSDDERRAVLGTIDKMRAVLRQLAADLGIQPQVQDLSREIVGRSSALWVHLVETESKYLRRYGELPEALPSYLDPIVEALIAELNGLAQVGRRRRRGGLPNP